MADKRALRRYDDFNQLVIVPFGLHWSHRIQRRQAIHGPQARQRIQVTGHQQHITTLKPRAGFQRRARTISANQLKQFETNRFRETRSLEGLTLE